MMLSLLLLWLLFLLLLILLLLSSSSLSSSSCLTNSCLAWYKSYQFMHLITKVKVSACMAYCHKVPSPKKFIIIIIMLIITFMQGISNYIPEKIHVSWVYSVAAVLYLQFVLLFHPWNRLFITITVWIKLRSN